MQLCCRKSEFHFDHCRLLIHKSIVDEAKGVAVPESLRKQILYLSHHLTLSGHQIQRRIYDTLRQNYYWRHMVRDDYVTIIQCASFSRKGSQYRHKGRLKFFSAKGILEIVAMEIIEPLPKTLHGNLYVLVITDCYSKLTTVIPTSKTAASHVANPFLNLWIVTFGVPTYLLADNGPQFACMFFQSVDRQLEIGHLTTTFYHPHTNR